MKEKLEPTSPQTISVLCPTHKLVIAPGKYLLCKYHWWSGNFEPTGKLLAQSRRTGYWLNRAASGYSVRGHKPRTIEVKQHPVNSVQWGSVNSQVGKRGSVHRGLETNSMFVSGDLKMTFHCCRENAIYYSEANKLKRIFCLTTLVIDTRTGYYLLVQEGWRS